jgi:hypothetical protein
LPNDDQKQKSNQNRLSALKAARLRAPLSPQPDAASLDTTDLQHKQADQSTGDLTATRRTKSTRRLDTGQRNGAVPQPIVFGVQVEEDLIIQPSPRPQRFRKTRRALQSRAARLLVPVLTLLLGIAIGFSSIYWYGSQLNGSAASAQTTPSGNIVVQIDKTVITQIVAQNLTKTDLPGTIKNVSVTLQNDSSMIIYADDVNNVFGLDVTRHLTINVQLYVKTCLLQIHITHVDLGGLPVTNFASSAETIINADLAKKNTGLPSGFTYCVSQVRTNASEVFVTYRATAAK